MTGCGWRGSYYSQIIGRTSAGMVWELEYRTLPMAVPTREPTRIDGSMNSHWDGTLPSNTSASSVRLTGNSTMPRKIGVLGLGSIGSRHYQNFEAIGCEVTA